MSSSTYCPSPIEHRHFCVLLSILREAHMKFTHLAQCSRSSYVSKGHARSRARRLGLSVNIAKAIACDYRQVSTIPLPIIEPSPLPAPSVTSSRTQTLLPSIRPAVLTRTTPNGTTSAFSASTTYSFVTLESAKISSTFEDDDEDFDMIEGRHCDTQYSPVPDVPVDAALADWSIYDQAMSEGITIKVEDTSMTNADDSPFSSPSPSTDDSSAGPATPEEQHLEPVVLRIKRKSAEISGDAAENFGKRTKLFNEDCIEWSSGIPSHRNIVRIPARRA